MGVIKGRQGNPPPKGPATLDSVMLPKALDKRLFLTCGNDSNRRMFGTMVMQARLGRDAYYPVNVKIEATIPEGNRLDTMDDVKKASVLDMRHCKKQVTKRIIEVWDAWLQSDDLEAKQVTEEDRAPFKEATRLRDLLAAYPAFAPYLLQQDDFKHLDGFVFQVGLEDEYAVDVMYVDKIPKTLTTAMYSPGARYSEPQWPEYLLLKQDVRNSSLATEE